MDRRRLVELESQQSAAKERAAFDDKQLAEIATLDGELEKRTRAYRDGMITRLGHEIAEAEAESAGCLKEDLHRRDIGTRMQGLVESDSHHKSAQQKRWRCRRLPLQSARWRQRERSA